MPTYSMRAPNGLTYRVSGPPNATDAQVRAEILRQYPEAGRPPKPKAKPRTRGTGIGFIDAPLDVINEALIGIPEGAYNLAAMVTDPLAGLIVGKKEVKKAQKERAQKVDAVARALVTQPRPLARELGRSVGPGAAVSRAAAAAAPVIQTTQRLARVPAVRNVLARVAQQTASGGLGAGRTAAQTAARTLPQRGAQLAERVAGGAISGGATAGLMGQDISEGMMYGAGLPVAANIVKRLGGRAVDLFRVPKLKAAEIIREALGKDVEATRQVLSQLSPDDQRLAQQVMVEAGLEPRAFFGLGKTVTKQVDPDTTARILAQEAAEREARLAGAAGGATMEDVRAATLAGRRAVTDEMAPVREAMYQRAQVASRVVPEIEALAGAAGGTADEQSALARRMTFGAERAETRIGETEDFYSRIGDEFRPEMVSVDRGLAGAMTQRGEKAALGAIASREEAQDLYNMIDDLAAANMRPMRASDLIGSLRVKLRDPEILSGSVEERTIKNVIRQLEKATDANGMLNARALGKIRRSGINEIVKRLSTQMGGEPSRTGTPEAAQATVLDLRNMIDDTLRRGGGGELVDEFIRGSEQGYAAVNRGELAGEALRLYKKDPKTGSEFLALVGGDRPKTVGKIMRGGPESESFAGAFANDPARLDAITQSARELKTLNRMRELGTEGSARAADIMRAQQPGLMERGVGMLLRTKFPSLSFATTGAQNVETATVSPLVRERLANAFVSGPQMREAMEQYPTSFRVSEQVSRAPAGVRNIMAQGLVRPLTADFPEIDPETGEELIEVTFDEYGRPTPVYGRVTR